MGNDTTLHTVVLCPATCLVCSAAFHFIANLRLWLSEVNTSPSLAWTTTGDMSHNTKLITRGCHVIVMHAGLDFILDANLRPWLLEVNASPSLAWSHEEPATAGRMRSIKSQMLADMVGLLRLQDRFPASSDANAAAAAAAAAAANCQQGEQQQHAGRSSSTSSKIARSRIDSQQDVAAVNPLVVQAASGRYFADRPQVMQLVREAEQQLQAAVAACPSLQQVQQQMRGALPAEQQQGQQTVQQTVQQQAQQQEGPPSSRDSSALEGGSSSIGRQDAGSSKGSQFDTGGSSTSWQLRPQFEPGQDDSSAVQQQLLELEAELQSAGGWQSLMPHMLGCMQSGDKKHSSVDAAVQRFWQQRFGSF
jgi:hypothetical protein